MTKTADGYPQGRHHGAFVPGQFTAPKGERYVGQTIEHLITEDANGSYRVHHPRTGICLSLHGTPTRAFEAADSADEMIARSRAALASA